MLLLAGMLDVGFVRSIFIEPRLKVSSYLDTLVIPVMFDVSSEGEVSVRCPGFLPIAGTGSH